jgi:hypothetical protein
MTSASTLTLTENGHRVAQLIATGKVSFFDDGLEAGSGTYSVELGDDMVRIGFKKTQIGGVVNGLLEDGFFTGDRYDADAYVSLTEAGSAYCQALTAPGR